MMPEKITFPEKAILLFILISLTAGYVLLFTNMPLFLQYSSEDGILEWLTVTGLLLGSIGAFGKSIRTGGSKGWQILPAPMLFGLLLFLAAGEELSWGQRIFDIESPEYFINYNSQEEINLHNLIINGISINKLVFSLFLIVALSAYLVILPQLYHRSNRIQRFISSWGIPVPKRYQVIAFILFFCLSQLLPHEKNAEFLENCTAYLLFLTSVYPLNAVDFHRQYSAEKSPGGVLNKING